MIAESKYRNVMLYQATVDILKNWLKLGKISRHDFDKMNTKLIEKYGISLSGIFVDLSPDIR